MGAGAAFGPGTEAELRRLAAAAYPSEGCGVLVGSAGDDGAVSVRSVSAARNLSERGRDRYELDPLAIVRAERAAREAGLDVVGFWHSHPDHPAEPSRLDTERAWAGRRFGNHERNAHLNHAITSQGQAHQPARVRRHEIDIVGGG